MSGAEQRIADACAAVIAAAIEDVVADCPDATPAMQAAAIVRGLRAEGWHLTASPVCALVSASQAPEHTRNHTTAPTPALRSA